MAFANLPLTWKARHSGDMAGEMLVADARRRTWAAPMGLLAGYCGLAAATAVANSGLFTGQSAAFFSTVHSLAVAADNAERTVDD